MIKIGFRNEGQLSRHFRYPFPSNRMNRHIGLLNHFSLQICAEILKPRTVNAKQAAQLHS